MAETKDEAAGRRGILASAKQVVVELATLARLERELARNELRQKGAALGAGAGVSVAAVLLLPFVIGFGLAAAAAALTLLVATWLALLIVFGLLLGLLVVLALVAVALFRRASPLKPEQAMDEARLTSQTLRRIRGG
jgi:Putative Actinobacterial Holin-X, holin superfamily III